MTITRIIHGKKIEIELTYDEMAKAAEQVKDMAYYSYLKECISSLDDDDDLAVLKSLEGDALQEALDDILVEFARLKDCDYEDEEAFRQAADDVCAALTR